MSGRKMTREMQHTELGWGVCPSAVLGTIHEKNPRRSMERPLNQASFGLPYLTFGRSCSFFIDAYVHFASNGSMNAGSARTVL